MSKKPNYSYIGIAFIVLLFGIIFIPKIVERLKNNDISRDAESRSTDVKEVTSQKSSNLAFIYSGTDVRKVPDFSFVNQNGDTITNKDYLGKVYVVEFFFTTCPTICPRMNRNLVEIQNHFSDFENFGVASFTINPAHDTPEVLKAYAQNYGMTNPNWHLMTGNQEDIYSLANKGFNLYAAEEEEVEGGFEHSGNFALIDKNGFIRSRLDDYKNPLIYYNGILAEGETDEDGMEQQITILKEDIAKLLKE
jgi:protein SCO1/2